MIPVYNEEILEEYRDVLNRNKFRFNPKNIQILIEQIKEIGIHENRIVSGDVFPDLDDATLSQNAGKVITYDSLMSHVWGPYADSNNRILRVNMANIRRKPESNPSEPQYIFTEIGIGYRMLDNENL